MDDNYDDYDGGDDGYHADGDDYYSSPFSAFKSAYNSFNGPSIPKHEEVFQSIETKVYALGSKIFPKPDNKFIWFITYYTPESQHHLRILQLLMPKFSKAFGKSLRFGAVDCHKHKNYCVQKTGSDKQLHFSVYAGSKNESTRGEVETVRKPSGKTIKKIGKEMMDFVVDSLPKELVVDVNRSAQILDKLKIKEAGRLGALLLTDKYQTAVSWIRYAHVHREKDVVFGISRGKSLEFGKEFGVKKYPMIVILMGDGKGGYSVVGKKDGKEDLDEWMKNTLNEALAESGGSEQKNNKKGKESGSKPKPKPKPKPKRKPKPKPKAKARTTKGSRGGSKSRSGGKNSRQREKTYW